MKKILLNILILIIVTLGVLGPIGAEEVNAETQTSLGSTYCWKGIAPPVLNLAGCSAIMSFYGYSLTSKVLTVSGGIFDSLLSFSLSKDVLNQDFIEDSWKNLRGFANILFILVLVVISISIILDMGQFASKDLIRDVIIIALIVNFSLFTARAVIDVGNITALSFYDAINISSRKDTLIKNVEVETKNISGAFMSAFNPAKLVSPVSFNAWKNNYISKSSNLASEQSADLAMVALYGFGIFMNVYMAYLFFMAGWIFVIRIIWLWVLMILSPLAFISYAIPTFKEYWKLWWNYLFNKSFCITVFMFFIWLTLTITSSDFFEGAFDVGNDPDLIKLISIILLQAILVFKLLGLSLSQMKKKCDDGGLGDKVFGMVKGATGLAMGVATGGVGLAASQVVGGWAARTAKATVESGGGTSRLGKLRLQTLRKIEGASFASTGFGKAEKGKEKFGVARFGKEGYKQRQERVAKEQTFYMKTLPKEVTQPKRFGFTGGDSPVSLETSRNLIGSDSQKVFRETIKNNSIASTVVSYVKGERKGEKKFVKDFEKTEKEKKVKKPEVISGKIITPKPSKEGTSFGKKISDSERKELLGLTKK